MDYLKPNFNPKFWREKRVLITGHTGFKGSWLSLWLQKMSSKVRGISLKPATNPAMFKVAHVERGMEHFVVDIRKLEAVKKHIVDFSPDVIFHMAAQPLVRESYNSPIETIETNIMGTVNVLEASRYSKNLKAIVNVTTDKCYENKEWEWGYRENEPMGGRDPYSSSKGCVELLSAAYRNSFLQDANIAMATARAGNVIGGGDWSPDRLLPDILRELEKKNIVKIRNPNAIRPWQHVLEPLSGYLNLAERLSGENGMQYAEGWNFGPIEEDARPVSWIADQICQKWPEPAAWERQQERQPHEANFLKLDIAKARNKLEWAPRWNLSTALANTMAWHQAWIDGQDMQHVSFKQIEAYMDTIKK